MNAVAERTDMAAAIDYVLVSGDLSKLTPEQRVVHYNNVCKSLGLNPLTQPFKYMVLNGKTVLYPAKDATDQLRKVNSINIEIASSSALDGLLTVHVRAKDKTGRNDEDYGVVSIVGLRGEGAANAFMKAVTKAKRRVTLSISGLGYPEDPFNAAEDEIDNAQPFSNLSRAPLEAPKMSPTMEQAARSAAMEEEIQRERKPEPLKPHTIERHGNDELAWRDWVGRLLAFIHTAASADEIDQWTTKNFDHLVALQKASVSLSTNTSELINDEIEKHIKKDT